MSLAITLAVLVVGWAIYMFRGAPVSMVTIKPRAAGLKISRRKS